MSELYRALYLAVAFLVFALIARHVFLRTSARSAEPPTWNKGRHWLTGNTLPEGQLPWMYWHYVSHQLDSPIFTWFTFNKPLYVVSGYRAAFEILEKQSGATADRPRTIMAGETMSGGKRILLVQYGERWRRLRKALHQALSPKMATSYQPIQTKAALTFMDDLVRDPDHFQDHAKKYAASVIMSITYGKTTPTSYSDPEVVAVNRCLGRLGHAAQPGRYWVDSLTFLQHLPGPWKSKGQAWHKEELELFSSQLDKVRTSKESESFGRFLLDHQHEYQLSDAELAYVAGSSFGAGSDTTAAALAFGIQAMTVFPEPTRLAQEEIDRVVGRERAPTFDDQVDLPYTQAWIKELHRWRPVSAGGFMHALLEDVVYDGYVLKKGSAIIGNHYGIMHDESVFPEPEAFKPERWFEDVEKRTMRTDISHVSYGFGRRACIGKNVADRSIFINVALLLWAFKYEHARDERGSVIPIDTHARTNQANSHPLPFKTSIKPRSEYVPKVLAEALRAS